MATPLNLTKAQEKKILEVGRKIEAARLELRLSTRAAADRTVTTSKSGHLNEATWRRTELGQVPIVIGGKQMMKPYRPTAGSLMAMAEVVGLDGEELCKELGLKAPPARRIPPFRERAAEASEISDLKQLALELLNRLERLEHR